MEINYSRTQKEQYGEQCRLKGHTNDLVLHLHTVRGLTRDSLKEKIKAER